MEVNYAYTDYKIILEKAEAFKKTNGRLPNYIDHKGYRVYLKDYQNPIKVTVNAIKTPTTPTTTKTTTATTIYNELTSHPYEYYYNSRYTRTQREQRYNNKQSMNCTDYSLYLYRRLKAAGYEVMAARGEVLCNDGKWYGHVWLEVRGGEFKNWVFYDSVSATKTKRPINQLCCIKGMRNRSYNPKWFMDLI